MSEEDSRSTDNLPTSANDHDVTVEHPAFEQNILSLFREVITFKLLLFIAVVGGAGAALVVRYYGGKGVVDYLLVEIGKSLLLTVLITGSVKWYTTRQGQRVLDLEESIRQGALYRALAGIRADVIKQGEELAIVTAKATERHVARFADSLTALSGAGIQRVYMTRGEASRDIAAALKSPDLETLDIIGISLNDFVRGEDPDGLSGAWEAIEEYVRKGRGPLDQHLQVRILVLDPECSGAYLRSCAEAHERKGAVGTRLRKDVETTLAVLAPLVKAAQENSSAVKFEARLYRTAPILNLVRTQSTTFFQQYYFRPRHGGDPPVPVLRVEPSESVAARALDYELGFHFDWIWDNASVPIDVYSEWGSHGIDKAIRDANLENAYYDADAARVRILHLIEFTKKTLWIKGITLRSFLSHGRLYDAVWRAAKRRVDVQILVIDPECQQARYRSLREYLITHPDATETQFTDSIRRNQRLVRESEATEEGIVALVRATGAKVNRYDSAPEAFFMITDESALVEQYHYGTIREKAEPEQTLPPRVLGAEVPVLEFAAATRNDDPLKHPYALYRDHFEFVYRHCSVEFPVAPSISSPCPAPSRVQVAAHEA
jgi:hypothetical protein